MTRKLIFLIAGLLFFTGTNAQNAFKYKRITVFKDGTSFIEKELNTTTKNKAIHFDSLPIYRSKIQDPSISTYFPEDDRITFGTLRILALNNEIIESKVDLVKNDMVPRDFVSIEELLKLNIGKMVTLRIPPDNKQTIFEIMRVVDNSAVFKSGNYLSIIPIKELGSLDFMDVPITKSTYPVSTIPSYSLDLKLLNDSKNQQVNISYLQKGITWLPSYFIDINEAKKGKLILEANLLNDIEDIENAEINFAVGVPAFAFKSVHEPLVSGKSMWEILRQLNTQQLQEYSNNIQMNMMTQQTSYNYRRSEQSEDYTPVAEGKGGEDLYFYKKQNVSLGKNGRLKTQILSTSFDYDDVYSCELAINAENDYNEKQSKANPVWHSIRFKNTSNQPLTTGTVFFRKENNGQLELISQNQLDYTPINEFVTARMAVAPDILVSAKDVETSREEKDYDHILDIKGEISIVNYKAFPVEMIIHRKIIGTMLNSDISWKVTSNLETYNAKNPSNQVSWKLKIEAGKTVQIKYAYKIIVD